MVIHYGLSIKIIIVEEARDEAKKEQITIILWFFFTMMVSFHSFFPYCACKRYYIDSKTRDVQCSISL